MIAKTVDIDVNIKVRGVNGSLGKCAGEVQLVRYVEGVDPRDFCLWIQCRATAVSDINTIKIKGEKLQD
jgi:hypothetical protein